MLDVYDYKPTFCDASQCEGRAHIWVRFFDHNEHVWTEWFGYCNRCRDPYVGQPKHHAGMELSLAAGLNF